VLHLGFVLAVLGWPVSVWAAITVAIEASRCSASGPTCPAPLSVIFKTDSSDAEFVEWHCEWNFGDTDSVSGASATWTNGVAQGEFKKKNRAIGTVAAHVYEYSDGQTGETEYTVSVTCVDPATGDEASDTESIFVDDPAAVWATTDTVCVSDTASIGTGCPAGATEVTSQSNYVTIFNTYALADRRVLLRRGGSFVSGSTLTETSNAGPTMIGAYGSGNKPEITRSDSNSFHELGSVTDWRFVDLNFTSSGSTATANRAFCGGGQSGCAGATANTDITILRVDSTGHTRYFFFFENAGLAVVGPATIVGSTNTQNNLWMSMPGGGAIIDTITTVANHPWRVQNFNDMVVTHNTVGPGGPVNDDTTWRGDDVLPDSKRLYVGFNKFLGAVKIGPDTQAGPTSHSVWESNWFDHGSSSFQIHTQTARVRYNVTTGSTNVPFQVDDLGDGDIPNPDDIIIEYNSMDTNDRTGAAVQFTDDTNTECNYNINYDSGAASPTCGGATSSTGNVTDPATTPWTTDPPTAVNHFILNASGLALAEDAGEALAGSVRDIAGTSRPQGDAMDVGAFELGIEAASGGLTGGALSGGASVQ